MNPRNFFRMLIPLFLGILLTFVGIRLAAAGAPPKETLAGAAGNPAPVGFAQPMSATLDLHLSKTSVYTQAIPGTAITYTLWMSHSSPITITAARISDALPAALQTATWLCAQCSPISGTGNVSASVTLPPTATISVTLRALIAPNALGTLTNTAHLLPPLGMTDAFTANNTAQNIVLLTPQADLALTAMFTPTAPLPGDLFTLTLTARNLGASSAHSLTFTGTLASLNAPLLTPSPAWTCGTGTQIFTCTLPMLAPSAPHTVTLSGLTPIEGGLLTHTAALTALTPTDPNPLNNTIYFTHFITPQADLALMLHAPFTATPGLPLTYTLIVSSSAPYTVANAVLHAAAPPQFQTFDWACAGDACPQPAGSGALTHSLTLAPNTPLTYTLGGTLYPYSSGTLTLTATLSTPPGTLDPAPSNNATAHPVSLMPQAALSLGYAQIITPAVPGLPYTVTLRAENTGPSAVNAVTLHSAAAPWATITFWGCAASAGGNCLPLTGTVALVDVPPFGVVTATLGLMLPPEATAPLTHTAALSIPTALWDTTPADNTVSFTLPLAPRADLAISLSAAPEPVGADAVLQYHLLAQNLGPSVAITPTLTFTMPPGIISSTLTAPGWVCNSIGDVLICGRAALTGSHALTVTVQTPHNSAPLIASATLTAYTLDPAPENNRAVVTSTITASADVQLMFDLPVAVDPLQIFNLSAQVQNAGPTAAHALTLTAQLPDGFAVTGVNAPGWTCVTLTCTRPQLENAASAPVTWQLRAPQPSQTATFTLTVAAHTPDSALGNNTQMSTTLVRNLAPVVNAGTLRIGVEGSAVTFGGSFSDPNGEPAAQMVWDFGDGQTLTGTLHPAHAYQDNGTFTVTLRVTDSLGAGGSDYTQAIVVNAPPVANAGPNRTVEEGSALTLLGAFNDAGVLDTHTLTWTLGDGARVTNSLTVTHVYADDGAYTAIFAVRDDDGGMDDDSALITVRNTAPWVMLNAPTDGLPGQTLVFTGTFGDAGVLDTHILIWDFDDGTLTQTRGLTVTHVYTLEGDFNVRLTVRDDDGGEGSTVQSVRVRIPPVYRVYLPALANNYRADAPDLQVALLLAPEKREFTAGEPITLTVLVTNAGSQPTTEPFWVDLYLNPSVVPNASNVPWSTVCTLSPCEGVAWYVTENLLPGESVRLTTTPDSYAADYTIWGGSFAAGTTAVYAYADSWKPGSVNGAVLERSELNNRGEILGVTVAAPSRNAAHLRMLQTPSAPAMNEAAMEFPDGIRFRLQPNSGQSFQNVTLLYGVESRTCTQGDARQAATWNEAEQVFEWFWDFKRSGTLPPGTRLWWQWEVTDANGQVTVLPRVEAVALDQRFDWKTLTDGNLTLTWAAGKDAFGGAMLRLARQSLTRIEANLGTQFDQPIWVTIYPSVADIRGAIKQLPDWTGGVAFPNYSVSVLGFSTAETDWAAEVIPHELNHLVVGMLTFNCSGASLPTWLNEGLSVVAEGQIADSEQARVLRSLEGNSLPELTSLERGFSAFGSQANLAYTQSGMVTQYLLETYGESQMKSLLAQVGQGVTFERALAEVYNGLTTVQLDSDWRVSLGFAPLTVSAVTATPTPPPTAVPTLGLMNPLQGATLLPSATPTLTPAPSATPLPPTLTPTVVESAVTAVPTAEPITDSGAGATGWLLPVGALFGGALLLGVVLLLLRRRE
ncbi:MAG: hypothetical protein OHK0052_10260 [Anaerolineales bacterium]